MAAAPALTEAAAASVAGAEVGGGGGALLAAGSSLVGSAATALGISGTAVGVTAVGGAAVSTAVGVGVETGLLPDNELTEGIGLAGSVLGGTLGRGKSCHSFTPTTPVLMAGGATKPIADVAIGDEVTTTDPATGETTVRKVTALHSNTDTELT